MYLNSILRLAFIIIGVNNVNCMSISSSTPFLVTDFDGTLAHYKLYEEDENQVKSSEIITLPASSGSGKIAFISSKSIQMLASISNILKSSNTGVICASGQRVSTMLQRCKYLPFFDYWISENGGRIHDNNMQEIIEWTEFLNSDFEAVNDLKLFKSNLENVEGVVVDTVGYNLMVRVKSSSKELLNEISSQLPNTLKFTFNLDCLDVQPRGCGKYQATSWLLEYVKSKKLGEIFPSPTSYIYLGDDDNDIEIASHAQHSFIANPCSQEMLKFCESKLEEEIFSMDNYKPGDTGDRNTRKRITLTMTEAKGIKGTEELLNRVLSYLNKNRLPAKSFKNHIYRPTKIPESSGNLSKPNPESISQPLALFKKIILSKYMLATVISLLIYFLL